MDNPQAVLKAIDEDRAELIRLATTFTTGRKELGRAEFEYEKAKANALIGYAARFKDETGGKRLPAEDIRKAYTHGTISKVWAEFLRCKANVEALEKVIRIRQSHLSSLQSELAYLVEELRRS